MKWMLFSIVLLFSSCLHALTLKPGYPARYVVKPGDTLWEIAGHYLEKPWEWSLLWKANPSIKNPNRLYPGDILILAFDEKTPFIHVQKNGVIKLSPNARPEPIEDPVPTIALADLKPFLDESLVLDIDGLSRAPYVVGFVGEHMLGSQGNEAYVKGLHPSFDLPEGREIIYSVFRQGPNYEDPITHESLGYKAKLVGQARLLAGGEPATILLTNIINGIRPLDRVLINDSPAFNLYFHPRAPVVPVTGRIIDMPCGMPSGNSEAAVGGVVVINRGELHGLSAGDVLGIYRKPLTIRDPLSPMVPIGLPPERIGEIMIFRTFTKTSFALIVRSTRAVYLFNSVSNP